LRIGDHETADYQPAWLVEVLQQAALGAGYPDWQHQHDITAAVFTWLERSHPGAMVTLDELFQKLTTALRQTGYPRVAAQLELTAPPLAIHLPELARDCFGELAFFARLEKRLQPLTTGTVRTLVCTGLAEAALLLSPSVIAGKRRRSGRDPLTIGGEIRDFIRHRSLGHTTATAPAIWFPGIDPPEQAPAISGLPDNPMAQPLAC
jgi:hypothetical protein